jgi:hypothetical protein
MNFQFNIGPAAPCPRNPKREDVQQIKPVTSKDLFQRQEKFQVSLRKDKTKEKIR